MKILKK